MPTKIIVTHQGAMKKKYGRRWPKIKTAVRKLVAADKRQGITTLFVPLDDPKFGQMRARTGTPSTFKDAIDHAYGTHRKPDYIAILGGPDIVPMQDMTNPLTGDDRKDDPVVPSDLPYACDAPVSDDVSTFLGPSRAVGRIPDLPKDSDPALLVALLGHAARWKPASSAGSAYFGLSTYIWRRSTSKSLKVLFGKNAKPRLSPDDGPRWTAAELLPPWHFINCHGARADTQFYGQKKKSYPPAHDASLLARKIARGTLASAECCYGAELFDPSLATGPGIAVTYLREGAIGFMGSTTVAYGPATRNNYADLICRFFVESARKGASLGRALLEARQRFVKEAAPINPVDLKTLAQFVLLGDPSARAVRAAAGPQPHGMSKRMAISHAEGRAELEATATVLVRGVDTVAPTSDQAAPKAVDTRLRKAAKAAGYEPMAQARTFDVRTSRNAAARRLVRGTAGEETRFHILSARSIPPAATPQPGRKAGPGRKAREDTSSIPKRLLLLAHEVAGKLVKVDQLYAHSNEPGAMNNSYEGQVFRKRHAAGSKSDHEAVMLDVGDEELVLRRFGGNAFSDDVLDKLVGHRIRGMGQRVGCTLILHEWVELDSAAKKRR
jgi:GNAT superfamily N-acetyltransferase